jgi:hypothetical protein
LPTICVLWRYNALKIVSLLLCRLPLFIGAFLDAFPSAVRTLTSRLLFVMNLFVPLMRTQAHRRRADGNWRIIGKRY